MLPERLAALSVRIRLLPLIEDELADWVVGTIREGSGTWVTGVPGAVAEFPCRTCDSEVTVAEEAVVARMANARFRLRLHEKLRAFAFDGNGPVVLGLPKRCAVLPLAETFTPLGADTDAIAPEARADELFDFGLGRPAHRFCIRTGDPDFIGTLREATGKSWSDVLELLGQEIIQKGPVRAVESALARIEVNSPIPQPGGPFPAGPHTKLVPRFLAAGEDAPEALKIPDYASPVASFYPDGPPA